MHEDMMSDEMQAESSHSSMGRKMMKSGNILKKMNTKMGIAIAVLLVAAAFAFYHKSVFVAAMVNGHPISRLAVIREVEKASGKRALDALVTEVLINNEASKKGITVSDDEVNDNVKQIEGQLTGQGQNLDAALAAQGLTRNDLVKQLAVRKKVEKMLGDKIQVTDADVDAYIKQNKAQFPKAPESEVRTQIKESLKQKKFSQEAGPFIESLRTQASISYYVHY